MQYNSFTDPSYIQDKSCIVRICSSYTCLSYCCYEKKKKSLLFIASNMATKVIKELLEYSIREAGFAYIYRIMYYFLKSIVLCTYVRS